MSPSTVYLRVNRTDPALCEQARQASVADLHEALHAHGGDGLMTSRMRPRTRVRRVSGPAVTAHVAPGDNLMMHRALVLAEPGDVLVVVCDDETSGAQWGDMAARYAMRKGLAGVVVQGCVRDLEAVDALGCAVWATHVSPKHPDKRGHGKVNAPVVCDGVSVQPGDLIVADADGVVCVPRALAPKVVAAALARMRREDEMAREVDAGAAPWDLAGVATSYAAMEVTEIDAAWDKDFKH